MMIMTTVINSADLSLVLCSASALEFILRPGNKLVKVDLRQPGGRSDSKCDAFTRAISFSFRRGLIKEISLPRK